MIRNRGNQRATWLLLVLLSLLLSVSSIPVAWAMPVHREMLQTVPTRTRQPTASPTPQPANSTPFVPPTASPISTATSEALPLANATLVAPPSTSSPVPTVSSGSDATPELAKATQLPGMTFTVTRAPSTPSAKTPDVTASMVVETPEPTRAIEAAPTTSTMPLQSVMQDEMRPGGLAVAILGGVLLFCGALLLLRSRRH